MSVNHGRICPIRRSSRSLRLVIHRCLKEPTSVSNLEELLRVGQGQWSWVPSLRYRRDPFWKSERNLCPRRVFEGRTAPQGGHGRSYALVSMV